MQDDQWKKLTPKQYKVLREKGTEAPFTGTFVNHKENGMYTCVACGTLLFSSDAKFDSGTGWPSFTDVVEKGNVELKEDTTHGVIRTEVLCKTCSGHLGHVFDDGPTKTPDGKACTGKRYCINSAALDFRKQ